MKDLTLFSFDQAEIRVLLDEHGEPWFVAKDVANALGMRDAANLTRRVPEKMKGTRSASTPGGVQKLLCLNEPGFYMAVMRSGKPQSDALCELVAEEILPTIRKTGSYPGKQMSPAEQLLAVVQLQVDMERKQAALEAKQHEQDQAIAKITAKQSAFEEGLQYFTVMGYAAYKGITVDLAMAQRIGKAAKVISEEKGLPVDRVKDQRFGYVNSYHETALDDVIAEILS